MANRHPTTYIQNNHTIMRIPEKQSWPALIYVFLHRCKGKYTRQRSNITLLYSQEPVKSSNKCITIKRDICRILYTRLCSPLFPTKVQTPIEKNRAQVKYFCISLRILGDWGWWTAMKISRTGLSANRGLWRLKVEENSLILLFSIWHKELLYWGGMSLRPPVSASLINLENRQI